MKLKEMSFEELVAAEKAASIDRKHYEDQVMMYRGIDINNENLNENTRKEYSELSRKLSLVNSVRLKILNEMEKKLLNIEYDD